MVHAASCRFLAIAALFLATSAAAQNYGPQPGYQPGYQPNPYQQPGPMPQAGQGTGGLSLVGTWSGQSTGPNGVIQVSDAYSADGKFVTVGRLQNGFLVRVWGNYRTIPVGPNQLRLLTQLEGWLPREVCQQPAGAQPQCQPFQIPTSDTSLVTFSSPNQFQSMSESNAGGGMVNEMRDNQPTLLQAQAPQRWVTIMQPSTAPAPSYTPGPVAISPRPYSPTPTPSRNPCPNDDIQTNICKYSGRLVQSGGCLRCVGG